jgi:hypothetical protein
MDAGFIRSDHTEATHELWKQCAVLCQKVHGTAGSVPDRCERLRNTTDVAPMPVLDLALQ